MRQSADAVPAIVTFVSRADAVEGCSGLLSQDSGRKKPLMPGLNDSFRGHRKALSTGIDHG